MSSSADEVGRVPLKALLQGGFIAFTVIWLTSVYFKKRAKEAGKAKNIKEGNEIKAKAVSGAVSTEQVPAPNEVEDETQDLFSDENYGIRDDYSLLSGEFSYKMVNIFPIVLSSRYKIYALVILTDRCSVLTWSCRWAKGK